MWRSFPVKGPSLLPPRSVRHPSHRGYSFYEGFVHEDAYLFRQSRHNSCRPSGRAGHDALFHRALWQCRQPQSRFGWEAEQAVDKARKQIADLIGATAKEIIFTSGATESNNLAIKGVAEMYAEKGNHIITAATEHKAVLDTCKKLEKHGVRVTYLPLMGDGLIDLDMLREAITDKTVLVSIMYANNEIGVLQPIREIGKICKEKGILFHTDGVQAVGKVPVNVIQDNIDLMSMSAHKIYGPKGVGALYVRRRNPRVQITAQMDGGGHERGMRSGTLNVPGIAGMGEACALCQAEMPEESKRLRFFATNCALSWKRNWTRSSLTAPWNTGCRTI